MKRNRPIIRVPDAHVIRVPESAYNLISYPTKLYRYCATRNSDIVIPGYSLPAGTACPAAVYGSGSVCEICYAATLIRLRKNVKTSHDHRFRDSVDNSKRWHSAAIVTGMGNDILADYMSGIMIDDYKYNRQLTGKLTGNVSLAVADMINMLQCNGLMAAVGYCYRLIDAMVMALGPQSQCPCCKENMRIRWHVSGDIYSDHYASLLTVVFRVLGSLYPNLKIWLPTRNWHAAAPQRLIDATDKLSFITNVNVVYSGLYVDIIDDAARMPSNTIVISNKNSVPDGYTACHAQMTHSHCGDCRRCYDSDTRVAYIKHR